MTPPSAGDEDGGPDVLALVREAVEARDDVIGFDVHEATPESVIVELETEEDGTTRRTLYRVSYEPTIDGDESLHWAYLGQVSTE